MRKGTMSIEEAKNFIRELRGFALRISVNKGRKKVLNYDGRIGDVYPSLFTLQITDDKNINIPTMPTEIFLTKKSDTTTQTKKLFLMPLPRTQA
jgi:uncharacterized protein Veg